MLPGAVVVLALSTVYAAFGNVPVVEAVFFGIKAAVLVIVIEALLRIAKRALNLREHWIIAALSFVAIFFLGAPFPLIVFAAALFGYLRVTGTSNPSQSALFSGLVSTKQTLRTIGVWLLIWFLPLIALAGIFGRHHVLTQMSVFFLFSKLAVVTFGGAYAVLAYMAQDVVIRYGWLDAGAMMDGLGLAETTPGPLILVTEFVGYLSAYRNGGGPAVARVCSARSLRSGRRLSPAFCGSWPVRPTLNGSPSSLVSRARSRPLRPPLSASSSIWRSGSRFTSSLPR